MEAARKLDELERELMDIQLTDGAADDYHDYKSIGKRLLEVVSGKKRPEYSSAISRYFRDAFDKGSEIERNSRMVEGSTVRDGYIGYMDSDGIELPSYSDKAQVDDVYKKAVNAAVGDHEINHAKYPGASELEVEYRSIMETENPVILLVKDALLNIGIGQGRKEARDAAEATGFMDRMKRYYNSSLKPLFEDINGNVAHLLGMEMKPEYAHSRVEAD